MLKLEKINKSFWNKQILFNINTSIEKWEVVWIIWPNWAWKSTIMKILTWFYYPSSWDVTIDWESIFKNNNLKWMIGYLPEVNPLYDDMGVDEFLWFAADLKQVKNKSKAIKKVLEMVWLKDKKFKFINTLSKWYKQRVGLAAALIWDPEILVLDEPTEWLDPNQRDEIKNLIIELWKTKTILISSHVLNELSDIVNRVIIVSDWKIKLDDLIGNIETTHKWKIKISIVYNWKINISEIKEKFSEINEIYEHKDSLEIITDKDIRKELLSCLVEKYDILEFFSKKVNLSDVFFETIK